MAGRHRLRRDRARRDAARASTASRSAGGCATTASGRRCSCSPRATRSRIASPASTAAPTTTSSSRSRSRSCSRGCARSRAAARSSARRVLQVGDLRLDPATRRVRRGDAEIALSAKEFALLETFMRRPGQVLDRSSCSSTPGTTSTRTARTSSTSTSATCARRSTARSASSRSRRCAASATGCAPTGVGGESAAARRPGAPRRGRRRVAAAVVWAVGDGGNGSAEAKRVAAHDRRATTRAACSTLATSTSTAPRPTSASASRTVYGSLVKRMAPTPGNHDWPHHATGYDPYWRKVKGRSLPHHYAFSLAGWRIISLNSETPDNAAQLAFLRRQLAGRRCVLAFMHRPRFNAGEHHDEERDVEAHLAGAARPRHAPALRPRPRLPALPAASTARRSSSSAPAAASATRSTTPTPGSRSRTTASTARCGCRCGPESRACASSGPTAASWTAQPCTARAEHDLDRAVLLLLEDLVGLGRLVERQLVGGEVVDAERVARRSSSGMMSSTQRLTLAWPIRSWICLSNIVIIGIGSAVPP